ncbi:hypothetical protein [Hymenobacter sp. B81]|uniref:hypothetical protein n=1 Tax=Hymenobacter sp. B81 TaxID=3344878 RepID=UPI0037DD52EE
MNLHAYPLAWTRHEAVRAAATRWQRRGLLSAEQLQAIEAAYPLDFYRPHLLLRIGLFIFTIFGASFGAGLLGIMFQANVIVTLVLGIAAGVLVLERLFIRDKRLYHAGADNALLYLVLLGAVGLIGYVVFEATAPAGADTGLGSPRLLLVLLLVLVVLLLATLRYADRLVAVVMLLTFLLTVTNLCLRLPGGTLLLPFALLLTSAGAYRVVAARLRQSRYLYYHRCLHWLKALTLLTAYLSVNYLVVREGHAALQELPGPSRQIPLAPLFYLTTAGIPLLYLVYGLLRPDRSWLWLGLLTAALSVYTLRHYRSVLPPETAAVLAGAALTAFAAATTWYLRRGRHGLTSAADDAQEPPVNLESLVVAQTAPSVGQAPAPGFQFGGGHSGGGGADGSY